MNDSGPVNGSNNLIEATGSYACNLTNGVSGNIIGSDPNLGPSTGSPAFYPLNSGSPAIDAGDDAICTAAPISGASQNGITRPQGAHCDIGSFELDYIAPTVLSVLRASPNPTSAATVYFTVTFSEVVTGVDPSDFALTVTGLTGTNVTGVSGSGSTYNVTVNTGSGDGTLRLDVTDNDSIADGVANPLGGVGVGNGDFASGESYEVIRGRIYLPLVLRNWP